MIALTLRLIIDTAFEISSKEREQQFGVLQSVGATPMQIVKILTNEGLMLSVIGVPIGALSGIGLGFAAYKAVLSSGVADVFFTKEKAEQLVHFNVNPWMVLAAIRMGNRQAHHQNDTHSGNLEPFQYHQKSQEAYAARSAVRLEGQARRT